MNFFSFENLGESLYNIGREIESGSKVSIYGLSDAEKYLIASLCKRPVLYLAADALTAKRAAEAISTLSGEKCALLCAKDEVLTFRDALSRDALFHRLNALYEIERGARVVVADVEAALQLVPKRLKTITLKTGEESSLEGTVESLIKMGYTRETEIQMKGTFALRGDILDVFPVNAVHPARVDFFGDEVEAIKPYDEGTGERLEKLSALSIAAATDAIPMEEDLFKIEETIKSELKKAPNAKSYARMQDIKESALNANKFDFFMPLLKNSCDLFSLLSENTVIFFDECKLIRDRLEGIFKEHEERFEELLEGGEVMRFSRLQLISQEIFLKRIKDFCNVALQSFMGETYLFSPLKMYNLPSSPVRRYLNSVSDLTVDLKAWQKTGYRVLLFCGDEGRVQKMEEELSDNGIYLAPMENLSAFKGIAAIPKTLEHGFILHECKLCVIGTGELFLKKAVERRIKKKRGDLFLAPEVGDYAVHETYGVGKITGTKKIETTEGTKEYVALEYKDGDTLYVPVEQMDVLSKYMGGENPALSKIGGGEFERVKARVRASLKKMAFDLKELYAERSEKRGFVFPEYREEMEEFEAAFPYEDTPDQAASFEEIRADMCSDKVMDRLLCGDVGFGKTEVALRAAYLCILAGKQAALMCPSTVLSEQHFKTATERMKDFGVRIACINRFKTEREQTQILSALKKGEVDLLIGTHRLLSKDVEFHDLGLLILDEEQRFGVEHKEKIKNLKRDVDCLTMTATPIPRTLHLSLSGIRDISTIRTPPHARLPVQTYVAEETESLIRDACMKEVARGGQVFLLYNRVETIYAFTKRMQEIMPTLKITLAHGRMDRAGIERSVFGFYRGEYDVLVTTTIIENGVDLPNANTLVVIDADRLGVSQLYQLRGRVGRSTRLAHAYFTYKPERVMTQNAAERLKALMQFTELGSGFKIAMRDLEIRGAGNVLGAEQHGHMDKVGYELYAKILKEELTGEREESIDLDIKTSAYIPESYVESNAGRLDCYKQIAEIKGAEDYKRLCTEMEETYGPMPGDVLNLLVIALMKSYAQKFGVKKISVGKKGGALYFSALQKLSDRRIQAALEKYKGEVGLEMTSAPAITFRMRGDGAKTMVAMTKFLKFASTFA